MSDIFAAGDGRRPDNATVDVADPPGGSSRGLRGDLGTVSVVLTVMAYLAPLAAAAGYIPLVIGSGNGLGAPLIFLLCTVVLSLFAFGYLAMVRHVPRPGAFYAYVSAGLGKRIGLGAGSLSITFYQFSTIGFFIFGAISMQDLFAQDLGINAPWWIFILVQAVIVGFCSYRGVDFNTRVLGVIVTIEFLLILIFNLATLFQGGAEGYSAEPFTWGAFTSGSIAVAMLFAIAFFVGFESTAIYREEVKSPKRTIPRATYLVIGTISVFYFLTAYCIILAVGPGKVLEASANDAEGTFTAAFESMLGHTLSQVVTVLVVTSVIASELAMVNASTRYVYSFSVDGVFPSQVSAVHKRHGSPHRAALVTNSVVVIGALLVAITGLDPSVAYGVFSGVMVFGFETLMLLVSLSAIVYFRRHRASGESTWNVVIAPALSIVCFGWLLAFSAMRADLLLGSPTPLTTVLFVILIGAALVGLAYASWLAIRKPDVYARIGRASAS